MQLSLIVTEGNPGEYRARCGRLPGCVGRGATPKQAVSEFLEAAKGYLAAATDFVPAWLEKDAACAAAQWTGPEPLERVRTPVRT